MTITAYASIGAPGYTSQNRAPEFKDLNILTDPVIVELAKKYEKTPAQICLNWSLNRNIIVIPKTTKVARLEENFNCYNFKLTAEEYESIAALDKRARLYDTKYMDDFGNFP